MSEVSGIGRRRAAARDERSVAYVQRRQEIVRAAARVFESKGLHGASLGDIAAEADADRASLYYYVGSKEELFHEVVREAVERNLAAAEEILARDADAREKLRAVIVSVMRSFADDFPVLYVFTQENPRHFPESNSGWASDIGRVTTRYRQILVDIIEQGINEGSIRSFAPARELAYGVLGMLSWTHRWFNPSTSELPAAELGRIFADTILGGLATPGRGKNAAPAKGAPAKSAAQRAAATPPAAKTAAAKRTAVSRGAAKKPAGAGIASSGVSRRSRSGG